MFKNKNGCFDCDRCPENNDRSKGRFCVAWVEEFLINRETGKQKVTKQCGFPYLIQMLHNNTKAADCVTENLTALPKRFKEELKNVKRIGNG